LTPKFWRESINPNEINTILVILVKSGTKCFSEGSVEMETLYL
jgi:hypothetical protein